MADSVWNAEELAGDGRFKVPDRFPVMTTGGWQLFLKRLQLRSQPKPGGEKKQNEFSTQLFS